MSLLDSFSMEIFLHAICNTFSKFLHFPPFIHFFVVGISGREKNSAAEKKLKGKGNFGLVALKAEPDLLG